MDTVGAQSWNGSLMETLIENCFHLHCGIAGNPKVQRLKMFCFSASLWGCFVYFCIINTATDVSIFWLSLLNCHFCVWKILKCLSICRLVFEFIRFCVAVSVVLIMPNLRGWLAQVPRSGFRGLRTLGDLSWEVKKTVQTVPPLAQQVVSGEFSFWCFPSHHQPLIDLTYWRTKILRERSMKPNLPGCNHTKHTLAFCHNDQPQKMCPACERCERNEALAVHPSSFGRHQNHQQVFWVVKDWEFFQTQKPACWNRSWVERSIQKSHRLNVQG